MRFTCLLYLKIKLNNINESNFNSINMIVIATSRKT